jgi:hypothetical protein
LENFLAKSHGPLEENAFVPDKETIKYSPVRKGYLGLLNKSIIIDVLSNELGTEHFIDQ